MVVRVPGSPVCAEYPRGTRLVRGWEKSGSARPPGPKAKNLGVCAEMNACGGGGCGSGGGCGGGGGGPAGGGGSGRSIFDDDDEGWGWLVGLAVMVAIAVILFDVIIPMMAR